MSFGKMREMIDIIQTIHNMDAAGFTTSTDTILASVRAYKEDRHGTKMWANRAAFSTATCLFRFRKIPNLNISPSLYIACSGVRYQILSAEDVRDKGMYVECLCDRLEAVSSGQG
ncbi:hypothetical protein AGMMS50284_4350 [Clostridia bacterium]|nr:hypothetical protein AGMMS50284_4350 [Clostridia bacterium]